MPELNFTNPQGQTLKVNSPDGSTPSESELDTMFSKAYGSQQPSALDEATSGLVAATQPKPTRTSGSVVSDIAGDVSRGALNSFAGTVDKVNAANSLLKNLTTIDLSNGELQNVSKSLRDSAKAQPSSDNPIVAGLGNFVGSIPDALAEFAGSGGGVGFIARSAALTALDSYNKNNNIGDLASGAVVGATVGAALNKLPQVLEGTAQLSKQWGETAGKKYLMTLTGMTEKDADKAMLNLNKYELNPKASVEDYGEIKSKSNQELSDFRSNNNTLISQQKEQLSEQYNLAKEKSQQAMQDLKENNSTVIQDLKDAHTMNMVDLVKSNSKTIMESADAATQANADAIAKQVQSTANAKNSLDNEMVSLFDTARQKLNTMVTGIKKNVGMATQMLDAEEKSYVPTNIIQRELDRVISNNGGKFYRPISGKQKMNLGGAEVDIPVSAIEGASSGIMASEGTRTPAVKGAINLINDVRNNLINDFKTTGKTSLAAIDANQSLLEGAISKGFNGEALPKNLVKILSDVKASLSLTRSTLTETGEKIPGLFDKYPKELAHLEPLAKANAQYASQIDGLKNSLSLYSDNIEGSLVPNPDKVFKALDSNNRSFLTRLQEADKTLPSEDRIFDKVKGIYNDYKYVEQSEKTNLSHIQKQLAQNRTILKTKLSDMEDSLKMEQMKQMRETISSLTSKKQAFTSQQEKSLIEMQMKQKETLAMLKAQKERDLDALQSSVNDRLEFLHLQSTLRGSRANPRGLVRIGQNVGTYRELNGILTANPVSFASGAIMSRVLSPIHGANIVKSAINAPQNTAKAKKVLSNKILKALLATKASGRYVHV